MSDNVPNTDKWLHADGSVTTLAGIPVLPADQNRAEEYANRAAAVDKWLCADGSIIDSKGKILLEADESRAQDFATRSPGVGGVMIGSGDGGGFDIKDDGWATCFPSSINESETLLFIAANIGDGMAFQLFPGIKTGEVIADNYAMSDTATAALS